MAFRIQRGTKAQGGAHRLWSEEELIWGVPRRQGYDDQDDPKAHAGLTQHAFEAGNDERAICGFEPPKRASGPMAKARPQLAMPAARLNPRCVKCSRLVATPVEVAPPPALATLGGSIAPRAPAPAASDLPAPTVPDVPVPTPLTAPAPAPPAPPAPGLPAPMPTAFPAPQPSSQPPPSTRVPPAPARIPPAPPALDTTDTPLPAKAAPETKSLAARLESAQPVSSESWEGTAVFRAGDGLAMVRPPSLPGLGVVASVVSGPSGTRVASVNINADGIAVIRLSEPASAPVTVAWFAVPAVDHPTVPESDDPIV